MLLLKLVNRCEIRIGRLGRIHFKPGLHCYVGSALGPDGLRARLGHHASILSRKHWHIDYLIPHGRLTGALVVESKERAECALATWAGAVAKACIAGFASSDCRCEGHLFFIGRDSPVSAFIDRAAASLGARHVPLEELKAFRRRHVF